MSKRTANVTWDCRPDKLERCSIGKADDDKVPIYDLALDQSAVADEKQKKIQVCVLHVFTMLLQLERVLCVFSTSTYVVLRNRWIEGGAAAGAKATGTREAGASAAAAKQA
jgi:hypothetical protein